MKTFDILSYHPGRQHNLEQAVQIQKAFKDFKHLTSFHFNDKTVDKWKSFSGKLGLNLKRRSSSLADDAVDTYSFPELKLLVKRALGYPLCINDYIKRNKDFQEWILKNYEPPQICIGFDTASWIVFEKWKHKSFLILDLSIATPQYKLTLAKENNFDKTFIAKQTNGDAEVYDIYAKELELADLVLCGSEFVKDSCLSLGIDAEKLCVIPYGADLERFYANEDIPAITEIVKVAFVGSVNYRKGADVLLNAWRRLIKKTPNIELHFYGNVQMETPSVNGVYYHGFLAQDDLIDQLRTAHISVLPTFFEGSSLAVYQSMAMGLAVITTPNAGSIIDDGRNGLLVSYGSEDELYRSLYKLITEPEYRKTLAHNASDDIKQFTWDEYGEKLTALMMAAVYEPSWV